MSLDVRNKLHRVRMMNSFISLTSSMVSIRSFPSRCNTSPSGGMSLQRGSSSVCQGQGKNNKNPWADESTWDQNYSITSDCTFLPRLTKNRLAAFTVGVSGNFSDKIPVENKRQNDFFFLNESFSYKQNLIFFWKKLICTLAVWVSCGWHPLLTGCLHL